uniref:Uncharacterized protein n=1 Tax=Sexangularia sp. CB-2014 TaxID=1486929 RepID=A0A7S1YC50_9EUKA
MAGKQFASRRVEVIGGGALTGVSAAAEPLECVLRMAVASPDRRMLATFTREVAPAATGMVPGLASAGAGRPKIRPMLEHVTLFVDRTRVSARVRVDANESIVSMHCAHTEVPTPSTSPQLVPRYTGLAEPMVRVRLVDLCYGRSGDKGDSANVALIARHPTHLPFLAHIVTESLIRHWFAHLLAATSTVTRFVLPGIAALNFLMTEALGGGGLNSLRLDNQGKTYGQLLLAQSIAVPQSMVQEVQRDETRRSRL